LRKPLGTGTIWSAFEIQPGSHFEEMKARIEGARDLAERHQLESTHMDSL